MKSPNYWRDAGMRNTKLLREMPLHLMLLPALVLLFAFAYIPMFGIVMGFQKYVPAKGIMGSKWVGFGNFIYLMNLPDTFQVLFNTVYIAFMKITAGIIVPVIFALLLNEVGKVYFKRTIQTIIYLPYFLSWIILSGILIDILSPSQGIVNHAIAAFGMEPVFFLGNEKWFPYIMVISDVWKNFGFGTIIYLAALTSIDPTYYEAAVIDGAGRWKQTWYVTLPGIMPIVVLMTTLSLGNVLNAGFDQIFNLYSPSTYKTGDIIDTMIYRLGMLEAQFGVATAVGFFRSVVSFIFVALSYKLADKYAGYRVF
jgi:putative aldouronate transport system permease protein